MTDTGGVRNALIDDLASYAWRPYDWIMWAFPWGEVGTELEHRRGPEPWQTQGLQDIQAALTLGLANPDSIISEAIQYAVKSGHNIGKSAWVCWLIIWAVSTREDTKGVVTANTEKQLRLKLWAELRKWHRLYTASSMFRVTATSIQAADPLREGEWRIDAIPWSEDNPEAFAGLHNLGKRAIVIFDEASGITDSIWETIDGVMSEAGTELIWIATGNPTRNDGRFVECFDPDGQGQFWRTLTVDSREVSFTNKDRIQAQIDLWGEDSDFIRVRWLGQFPTAGSHQLISSSDIRTAMYAAPVSQHWEPLILGVDVARYGDNENVATFRRGKDARTIPATRWRGLSTDEGGDKIAALIHQYEPDAVFIDEGGVGGGVIDWLRRLGHPIIGVHFGATPSIPLGGELAYNKRAEMYLSTRFWLRTGGCIEPSRDLERQLVAIEYGHSKASKKGDAIILTPKEEMDESPDWGDSLALTFAHPVSKRAWRGRMNRTMTTEYDPLASTALPAMLDAGASIYDHNFYPILTGSTH